MRMDPHITLTSADIVNSYFEAALTDILAVMVRRVLARPSRLISSAVRALRTPVHLDSASW